MDESKGMKKAMKSESKSGGSLNIKDNTQSGEVRSVRADSEQYDISKIKPYKVGSKGYSAEAWNYKY